MEISGFLILLGSIVLSRIIQERGYQTLTAEEKVRLMDGFSRTRAYALVPLMALVGLFYFLMRQTDLERTVIVIGYFGLLMVYVVMRLMLNQKKLAALQMPATYQKYFGMAQTVSLLGVAWFFYTLFYNLN